MENQDGNLNAGVDDAIKIVLCIKRLQECDLESKETYFIEDIAIIWADVEPYPEGYIPLDFTPSGFDANLNTGTIGTKILVCVKKSPLSSASKVVFGIKTMWNDSADVIPQGFTKIFFTPCGLEANLNSMNQGHEVYLLMEKKNLSDTLFPEPTPSLRGKWETTLGQWQIKTVSKLPKMKHLRAKSQSKEFHIYCFPKLRDKSCLWQITGYHKSCDQKEIPGVIQGCFDKRFMEASLSLFFGSKEETIRAYKDCFCAIGYSFDHRSCWNDGIPLFSAHASSNSIQELIDSSMTPECIQSDNSVYCNICDAQTPGIRYNAVFTPPRYLIASIKRFSVDYRHGIVKKDLNWVDLSVKITLPCPHPNILESFDYKDAWNENTVTRIFGLYGIVVHVGSESGHYYCYVRRSDGDLLQEDDVDNPWHYINDKVVTQLNWKGIVKHTRLPLETPYVLFFKRMDVEEKAIYPTIPEDLTNILYEDNRKYVMEELGGLFNGAYRRHLEFVFRNKF